MKFGFEFSVNGFVFIEDANSSLDPFINGASGIAPGRSQALQFPDAGIRILIPRTASEVRIDLCVFPGEVTVDAFDSANKLLSSQKFSTLVNTSDCRQVLIHHAGIKSVKVSGGGNESLIASMCAVFEDGGGAAQLESTPPATCGCCRKTTFAELPDDVVLGTTFVWAGHSVLQPDGGYPMFINVTGTTRGLQFDDPGIFIELSEETEAVRLEVAAFASSIQIEAVNWIGDVVASATAAEPHEKTVTLTGPGISGLKLVGGGGEGVLVSLCVQPDLPHPLRAPGEPVKLGISRGTNGLVLSWKPVPGNVLESSTRLGSTAAWSAVIPPPTIPGSYTVEPRVSTHAAFRVRNPGDCSEDTASEVSDVLVFGRPQTGELMLFTLDRAGRLNSVATLNSPVALRTTHLVPLPKTNAILLYSAVDGHAAILRATTSKLVIENEWPAGAFNSWDLIVPTVKTGPNLLFLDTLSGLGVEGFGGWGELVQTQRPGFTPGWRVVVFGPSSELDLFVDGLGSVAVDYASSRAISYPPGFLPANPAGAACSALPGGRDVVIAMDQNGGGAIGVISVNGLQIRRVFPQSTFEPALLLGLGQGDGPRPGRFLQLHAADGSVTIGRVTPRFELKPVLDYRRVPGLAGVSLAARVSPR